MQFTTAEAKRLIFRLGLECEEDQRHVRAFLTHNGQKMWMIHCPIGHDYMPADTADRFRLSMRLTVEEFEVLRSYKMDRTAYVDLLRRKGELAD